MKSELLWVSLLVVSLLAPAELRSATITWDGEGGDFRWQNPMNWSGDALPGTDDDVVIAAAGDVTIRSEADVVIGSLQCANHLNLAGGTFRVSAGSSLLEGRFSATDNPMLSAIGSGTSFVGTGDVDAGGAAFEAVDGATLSLGSCPWRS